MDVLRFVNKFLANSQAKVDHGLSVAVCYILVAGPVGAVAGGDVGAVATAPGSCYLTDRYERTRRVC